MKHRKCDTDKYRRRMKKQNAKHREHKRDAALQRKLDADRHLALKLNIIPSPPPEQPPVKQEVTRLVQTLEKVAEAKRPVCPLCNQDITPGDHRRKNVKTVILNRVARPVHVTCPTEVK